MTSSRSGEHVRDGAQTCYRCGYILNELPSTCPECGEVVTLELIARKRARRRFRIKALSSAAVLLIAGTYLVQSGRLWAAAPTWLYLSCLRNGMANDVVRAELQRRLNTSVANPVNGSDASSVRDRILKAAAECVEQSRDPIDQQWSLYVLRSAGARIQLPDGVFASLLLSGADGLTIEAILCSQAMDRGLELVWRCRDSLSRRKSLQVRNTLAQLLISPSPCATTQLPGGGLDGARFLCDWYCREPSEVVAYSVFMCLMPCDLCWIKESELERIRDATLGRSQLTRESVVDVLRNGCEDSDWVKRVNSLDWSAAR